MRSSKTAITLTAFLALVLATSVGCGSEEGQGDDDPPFETVDAGLQEDPRCNVDIVDPIDNDNCCPDGANANNDNDCAPVCGNGVLEGAEECDDGNNAPGDGCDAVCVAEAAAEATPLRIKELHLREPHVFAFGFVDVTATVNGMINDAILQDLASPTDPETPDGLLDFSFIALFRPYDTEAASTDLDIVVADCVAPLNGTECVLGVGQAPVLSMATNLDSNCLDVLPDTDAGHSPAITTPAGPCFTSDEETFDLLLGGIAIHLIDGQMAATYAGSADNPQLTNGLMRGFLSVEAAAGAIIPEQTPLFGGLSISEMLKVEDKDTGPNGEDGWWFYMNFSAEKVSYSD
jgi:cysteine-rich repeat protein